MITLPHFISPCLSVTIFRRFDAALITLYAAATMPLHMRIQLRCCRRLPAAMSIFADTRVAMITLPPDAVDACRLRAMMPLRHTLLFDAIFATTIFAATPLYDAFAA